MIFAIFHDFPGLENGLPKFDDFPWPEGTLILTYEPEIEAPACFCDTHCIALWIAAAGFYVLYVSVTHPTASEHW